jgi:hypothetical protein
MTVEPISKYGVQLVRKKPMRRIILLSLTFLFVLGLGSVVLGSIYVSRIYDQRAEISPVRLDRTLGSYCFEPQTTDDFQEFWREFRGAVGSEDKEKLFALIHTCSFNWWGPSLPLRDADCVPGPVEGCQHHPYTLGGRGVFGSRNDFDMTYDRIFTKAIRTRIMDGSPWKMCEGFAISWESDGNGTDSLTFEKIKGVGYKFSGLDWEPDPPEMLRLYARDCGKRAAPEPPSPPPNSAP